MNHTLSKTYNIDTKIQEIQTYLYDSVTTAWGTTSIDAYGRVYKNKRDGNVIPEVYDSVSKDYQETLYNNRSCFFFVDEDTHNTDDDLVFNTSVDVIFMLNLEDVSAETERVDAMVKRDVLQALRRFKGVYEGFTYRKELENVFSEFDTSHLSTNDMQPYHVFSFRGDLNYYVNDKCN